MRRPPQRDARCLGSGDGHRGRRGGRPPVVRLRRRGADSLSEAEAGRLDSLRKALRWERNEREQRLREAALTVDEGEALAESILGIDRALELLADPGEADLAAEMADSEREDVERWLDFLQSVT